MTGYDGIDFGQWTEIPNSGQLKTLYEQGVKFAVVAVGDLNRAKRGPQIEAVLKSDLACETYPYLVWTRAESQCEDMLRFLEQYPDLNMVWLDAEDEKSAAGLTPGNLNAIIDRCFKMVESAGHESGMYTAKWWWDQYMAGSTKFKDKRLWYAHFNRVGGQYIESLPKDFSTYKKFGGWEVPHTRQYIDSVQAAGLNVDRNYREVPLGQSSAMKYLYPVPSTYLITQRPGQPSVTGIKHQGADFGRPADGSAIYGTTVKIAQAGMVYEARDGIPDNWSGDWRQGSYDYGGYGNHVKVKHDDHSITLYSHLIPGSLAVAVGQRVAAGQPAGKLGTSGLSSGPHLHFELRLPPNYEVFDFIAEGYLVEELEEEDMALAQQAYDMANFEQDLEQAIAKVKVSFYTNEHSTGSRAMGEEGIRQLVNMFNLGPKPHLQVNRV